MRKIYATLSMLFLCSSVFSQNPQMLKDIFPGNNTGTIQRIVKTTNYTFFNQDDDDADTDRSLFRTDGTNAGTIKLNLTYPGYLSTKAELLTALGNKVIFAGDNFTNYGEIWSSDGTQAGTVALERFQPNSNRIPVVEINTMGSYAYYSVIDKDAGNVNHAYLKRTDGTAAGTSLVYDFSAFTGVPQVVFLTPVNNILYFIVYDQFGTGTDQLWRSDGTTAGTYMVYDFTSNGVESFIMPVGNNMYILLASIVGGVRQNTIWKSDGTAAGTVPVKLIGTGNTNTYPPFVVNGSTLYFAGVDGNGKELWQTDGTVAGTFRLTDINPGAGNSNPSSLTVLNNTVYFAASDPTNGGELWKYSGGVASLVKDINPGAANSAPGGLTVSNNTILFNANNGVNGGELWISDGTAANTVMVADINPGAANSIPNTFTAGNPVYFAANNGTTGFEVYKYDNSDGIAGLHKLYVNDNSTSGDIITTTVGSNTNPGTRTAPVATISHAITIAQPGDTIYVDAGIYTEQITIDKGITIIGAGQNLTSILKPAVTVAPPAVPPSTFAEQGVIQTAQSITGDVHISNLSVTGDYTAGVTPIIIQSGGSVKNCKLQNGNQGIFVRIDPNIVLNNKTFIVDGNTINAEYIAVNFAGGIRLTAFLTNNTIAASNPGFSSGTWAGTDFGTLSGLTITGNLFSSYVSDGLYINSNNCSITQNSFLGTGQKAINKFGGSTINASCNWFGSPLAATVATKITGGVNYIPWLTDGTDNNPAVGFQTSSICPVANSFYVNDNSTTGDVFTTAVGNNANPGTAVAPFATLDYAISQVPEGATLFVDAGTYAERVIVNKSVYLKGAYADVNPGNSLSRGISESILIPSAENNILEIMTIQSPNVTVDGFLFNGDNPSLTGSITLNGVDVNAGMAINNGNLQTDNLVVKNNIIKNFYRYGVLIQKSSAPVITGSNITKNRVDNVSSRAVRDGRGLCFFQNVYGSITNNNLTRVHAGVFIVNHGVGTTSDSLLVANNTIEAYNAAINLGFVNNQTSPIRINNNLLSLADLATWVAPGSSTLNNATGVSMGVISSTKIVSLENNTITGFRNGIFPSSINTPDGLLISGGSVSNSPGVGVFYNGQDPATAKLTLNNLSLQNNDVGIDVSATDNTNMPVEFSGVTISGGSIGLRVYSPKVTLAGNTLTGISFANQSNSYIMLTYNAFTGLTIDATSVSFDGLTGASMTLAQRFAVENKIVHRIDYNGGGFIRIKANEAYVTANSFIGTLPASWGTPTTTPDINRAIASVSNGNSIYVDAGTYSQDMIIDKSVNIFGAKAGINPGASLDRGNESILVPSSTDAINTAVVRLNASNIIIDGFTIDGDKPGVSSGVTLNGNDINAGFGIGAGLIGTTVCNNITIRNNIIRNTYRYGVYFQTTASASLNNNLVTQNHIDNISAQNVAGNLGRWGRAVGLATNGYASVSNNIITRSASGIWYLNANLASASATFITGNIIETYRTGVEIVTFSGAASSYLINQNEFSTADLNAWNVPGSSTVNNNVAVRIVSMLNNTAHSVLNNKINGTAIGVFTAALNNSAGQTLIVNNNSILQTTGNAIQNEPGGDGINVSCNWYGSAAAQDFINKISLATVDIVPWLTNGTDNDVATGFQPVPGSCDGYPTLITLDSYTDVTCNGASNGSINITTSYGKAPFTYTWTKDGDANFVSHAEDPSGLAPGTYHLSVVDGNGSNIYITDSEADGPGTIDVTITEPPLLTAVGSGTNVSCFGGSNGTASVSAGGGTAPYTYLWNNGGTTNAISNLTAGLYSVTVTDANGCTAQSSYLVTQPIAALTVSVSGTSASCNGTATATPSGGTTPYTYAWSNGGTTPSIINVPAGVYTVIVTDAKGCTTQGSVTLVGNSTINPKATAVNPTCFGGSNGSITVTSAGGVAPHTYNINGGAFQASNVFSNLPAGTYIVGAKDANGCSDFVTKVVGQPALLIVVKNTQQNACFGQNNGAITITASGGAGGYTYAWTGPNGYTSTLRNISNLAAGNYSVIVKDVNNCTSSLNATIITYNEITVNSTITNVLCTSGASGAINITVSGGSGSGFTYVWTASNGYTANTEDVSNLLAKTYTVTITDIGTGCVVTRTYPVTEPTVLNLTVNNANAVDCNLGTITATGSGGASGYEYKLDNGSYQSSGVFTGVPAGTYIVSVRDANGCTKSASVTITDNGKDEHEANNSKNKATDIAVFTTVSGRIALASDAADWFKFTTPNASGIYTLVFNPNSAATFSYDIYPAGNGPALTPEAGMTTPVSKSYTLAANTLYYISVTGGLSYTCYQLSVTQAVQSKTVQPLYTEKSKPAEPVSEKLNAIAFPNPHQGNFVLQVEAPQDGQGSVHLIGADGKTISTKNVVLRKGNSNLVRFTNIRHAVLFYRVILGKQEATGKVIGQY